MATVANKLIASTLPCSETSKLCMNGASSDELIRHKEAAGRRGDIPLCVASSILSSSSNFASCVAKFGRVDAVLVVSSGNYVVWCDTILSTDVFAACILGIVVDCDSVTGFKRMSLDPDRVKLPLGVSRERATHLQTLYRAQRAALAGGRPVHPALVAAAYPQVKVETAHIASYISEMKQWVASKRADIAAAEAECDALLVELPGVKPASVTETSATQAEIDQIEAALAEPADVQAAEAARAAAVQADARQAIFVNGMNARLADMIAARFAEQDQIAGALAAQDQTAAALADNSAVEPAAVEPTPVAAIEPAAEPAAVAIPVDVRDAVAELTKAIAALAKLLGQPAP